MNSRLASRLGLLHGRVRVVQVEVVGDDRNRKSRRQDSGQGTESAYDVSGSGFRVHIAVSYRREGDDGPPVTVRYRLESVRHKELGVVDDDGEYEDNDEDEH